jgi:hypothetical protein
MDGKDGGSLSSSNVVCPRDVDGEVDDRHRPCCLV